MSTAAWAEDMIAFDTKVGEQDQALVEAAQLGLSNGLIDHGRLLADSEQLLLAFERFVFERCEPYLSQAGLSLGACHELRVGR